jgi:hypothetical protein
MKTAAKQDLRPPKFLQHALWSYDLDKMNIKKDHSLIITQVLNYGNLRDVRWLMRTYPEKNIKKAVADPGRGVWLKPVLTFWTTIYNIKLDKETFENAIYEPNKIKEKYLKK